MDLRIERAIAPMPTPVLSILQQLGEAIAPYDKQIMTLVTWRIASSMHNSREWILASLMTLVTWRITSFMDNVIPKNDWLQPTIETHRESSESLKKTFKKISEKDITPVRV